MPPAGGAITARVAWDVIKDEFIRGIPQSDGNAIWPNPSALAKRWQVKRTTLTQRIWVERWGEQRKAFVKSFMAKREELRAGMVTDAATFDGLAIRAARNALILINQRLQEIGYAAEERQRIIAAEATQSATNGQARRTPPTSVIVSAEVRGLASAAATWHKLGRDAMGKPLDTPVATPKPPVLDGLDDDQWSTLRMIADRFLEARDGAETARGRGLDPVQGDDLAPAQIADIEILRSDSNGEPESDGE
jgi:hypothetical protein